MIQPSFAEAFRSATARASRWCDKRRRRAWLKRICGGARAQRWMPFQPWLSAHARHHLRPASSASFSVSKLTQHARGLNELVVSRDGAAGSISVALPDGMSPNRIPSVQLCVHKWVTSGPVQCQSTRSTCFRSQRGRGFLGRLGRGAPRLCAPLL